MVELLVSVIFFVLLAPVMTPAQSMPERSIVDTVVPVQSVQTLDYIADTINVSPFLARVSSHSIRDSANENDTKDSISEPCSVTVVRAKIKKDPALSIITVITCHGTNFETVEHTYCGAMCETPASMQFRDNPRTIGIQFFIPGGIALMIGTIGILALLDYSSANSGDNSQAIRSSTAVAIGGLAVGGALVFEGFKKIRIHHRWETRYTLKTNR
jgi:hypothetical protein